MKIRVVSFDYSQDLGKKLWRSPVTDADANKHESREKVFFNLLRVCLLCAVVA